MSSFCTAKATHIFFSKKFQYICVSLDVNFNESLTNDVVSFEQLGPGFELGMFRTNYHGPKDVRAIEVRLYILFGWKKCSLTGAMLHQPFFHIVAHIVMCPNIQGIFDLSVC